MRYGPIEGLTSAVTQTWQMSVLTVKMLGKMIIGQASLKNLSGPVTIADYAGQSVRLGLPTTSAFSPSSASASACSTCCRCRSSMAGT